MIPPRYSKSLPPRRRRPISGYSFVSCRISKALIPRLQACVLLGAIFSAPDSYSNRPVTSTDRCAAWYVETLAVMARYNPVFEHAWMTRVDLPENTEFERDIRKLEALGFRRELLASKRQNLRILEKLAPSRLQEVSMFALKHCVNAKFRMSHVIPLVRDCNIEALSEALRWVKSNALYLYYVSPHSKSAFAQGTNFV